MATLVIPFTPENLANQIAQAVPEETWAYSSKRQTSYLSSYLSDYPGAPCKTIVTEPDYIDKEYLIDYSHYYNRCFTKYGTRCTRLHFFSEVFEVGTFDSILINYSKELHEKYQASYLGFVVITPLPKAIFGRSLLKPYPSYLTVRRSVFANEPSSKRILTVKNSVNLHGLELEIQSAPFIEQDKVTSACASASLWSFLLLNPAMRADCPAPSEITELANNGVVGSYPSTGLTFEQMLEIIKKQGLEPKFNYIGSENFQKNFLSDIYSYINCGYPVLLGAHVFRQENQQLYHMGNHAVTAIGFSADYGEKGPNIAKGIKKLILHDDQQGPYIRCEIISLDKLEKEIKSCSSEACSNFSDFQSGLVLKSTYEYETNVTFYYLLSSYLTATYHKIRLSPRIPSYTISILLDLLVDSVVDTMEGLKGLQDDGIIEKITRELKTLFTFELNLELSNEYKQELITSGVSTFYKPKADLLTQSWPKYIWRARIKLQNMKLYDVIFDATDSEYSNPLFELISFGENYEKRLLKVISELEIESNTTSKIDKDIIKAIFAGIVKSRNENPVEALYGPLRQPYLIDEAEMDGQKTKTQTCKVKLCAAKGFKFKDNESYIWAIDENGDCWIAEEKQISGHPILTSGALARAAGDAKYIVEDRKLEVKSKSGRYGGVYAPLIKREHYENAAKHIYRLCRNDIDRCELSYQVSGMDEPEISIITL